MAGGGEAAPPLGPLSPATNNRASKGALLLPLPVVARAWDTHGRRLIRAFVPRTVTERTPGPLFSDTLPPLHLALRENMTTTARITSEHLQNAQFQGQSVRAVGKLISIDGTNVQLQLAGPEGASPCARAPRSYVFHVFSLT